MNEAERLELARRMGHASSPADRVELTVALDPIDGFVDTRAARLALDTLEVREREVALRLGVSALSHCRLLALQRELPAKLLGEVECALQVATDWILTPQREQRRAAAQLANLLGGRSPYPSTFLGRPGPWYHPDLIAPPDSAARLRSVAQELCAAAGTKQDENALLHVSSCLARAAWFSFTHGPALEELDFLSLLRDDLVPWLLGGSDPLQ